MARRSSSSIPLPGLRWRGLNLQLFVLIILPLTGILLLITLGSLTLHQRAMRSLVGERDERAARTAAVALSEQLNHRAAAVRGLALRASDDIPLDEILTSSKFLNPDFDLGMAFYSPQGELLASSGDTSLWEKLPDEFYDLLTNSLTQPDSQAIFSSPIHLPSHDEHLVFVAAATDTESPIAVGAFLPANLAQHTLAGAFSPGEQSAAFLVGPDNKMLYQIGDFAPTENRNDHPGIVEALRGESGTTYLQVDGSEHVIAFSPVLPTGWALVIEEPWESVANPLLNTTQLAPLVLIPGLMLALVALWFGARQIVQPLQDLEARASDLAWGDFQAIEEPVGGIEEIGRLQHTLIHLAHKVRSSQQGLRDYIGAITAGQEEERRRLARELHDETIQALIALNQRVQMARLSPPASVSTEQMAEIQMLTEQTIQDLRRLTRALRPLYLEDLGLVAALEMLTREISEANGIPIDFQLLGVERRLLPDVELALYRMVQEGLNNVIRHAKAKHATVTLRYKHESVILMVVDDGCGFEVPESPAEFAPTGHFGLLGLHERAELIGADLEIHSSHEGGTRLMVSLPSSSEDIKQAI
ncbi:MAG: histidine kinase [Anaerolineales bacterium]|nr:histidine kinase [Anaerolineales bacterium]